MAVTSASLEQFSISSEALDVLSSSDFDAHFTKTVERCDAALKAIQYLIDSGHSHFSINKTACEHERNEALKQRAIVRAQNDRLYTHLFVRNLHENLSQEKRQATISFLENEVGAFSPVSYDFATYNALALGTHVFRSRIIVPNSALQVACVRFIKKSLAESVYPSKELALIREYLGNDLSPTSCNPLVTVTSGSSVGSVTTNLLTHVNAAAVLSEDDLSRLQAWRESKSNATTLVSQASGSSNEDETTLSSQ